MTFDLRSDMAPSRRDARAAREERLDVLHRVVTGQAENRRELGFAGYFVAAWFLMDLVQWLDWFIGKLQ